MYKFAEDMASLNRVGISIKGKKPLYDWINKIDPVDIAEEDRTGTFYLLPEHLEMPKDIAKFIMANFRYFFEHELYEWYTDESLFPKRLTYKLFLEWFDVTICDMVYDTTREDE
jgi:hypothetical protein